jgi:hypothetical protein
MAAFNISNKAASKLFKNTDISASCPPSQWFLPVLRGRRLRSRKDVDESITNKKAPVKTWAVD